MVLIKALLKESEELEEKFLDIFSLSNFLLSIEDNEYLAKIF
jgi:hypothetical protein